MGGFTASVRNATESMLPVIPAELIEVEVVHRWAEGIPAGVPVSEAEGALTAAAEAFDVDSALLETLGASGSAGDVRAVPRSASRLGWVVGVGKGEPKQWRIAGGALARTVRDHLGEPADEADPQDLGDALDSEYVQVRLPSEIADECVAALTLGLCLGDYRFRVSNKPALPRLRKALLVVDDNADAEGLRAVVQRARHWASATVVARDLANSPSNVKNPAWLTATAAGFAEAVPGLDAVVRDEKWLTAQGFGGVLAVGGGSASPPRLLEMTWCPAGTESAPHVVLVGKGITFDTGGLSIKPAEGMHLMRTDMAGGAAVIGAMLAIARLELPVRVTALVPSAENHVSGSSYRPGDIVRHYGGKTTEVGNTDAEGRMVLADCLAYAAKQFQPDLLVDVATLTGATKVALGLRIGGLFTSEPSLNDRVRVAGDRVGEQWWPMPLIEDHVEDLHSEIADVKQAPGNPGGVTAALFLREFTNDLPWIHMDIAGPARADKPYAETTPGGTGFAARSLVELAAGFA